jgi:5-oxopent-3-ene-1,2,5-tricarboxylate decarboxylase/2-hydroxyhepta-2,4-diene-1,7-dioate isomerase
LCERREDVVQRVRIEIGGDGVWGRLEGERVLTDDGRELTAADVRWLAPVAPSKIIAVHLTYRSRLIEYAVARMPAQPSYFIKPPSTLNGHLGALRRPAGTHFLNYEGELAVIVGKRMHGVAQRDVLDHVYGFAPANDVGLHDFRHADRGAMLRVKGQDGFLPIGPAVLTADEWRPDDGYLLRTRLNGELVQEADAADLIWDYRYQLADLCRLITLEAGDVILTGTPANSRPMAPGDVVEVEISGMPTLRNHVEEWDVDLSGPGEQPEVSANTLHVALAIGEDEAERLAAERRRR